MPAPGVDAYKHEPEGDHPKTAEAIARKINLILGDTKETLAAKTGRGVDDIYEDEVTAVVVHGDDIDGLQGWQWDNSKLYSRTLVFVVHLLFSIVFNKQEIVFARTSPQHKLEIGKLVLRSMLYYFLTKSQTSQKSSGSRTHCRSVSTAAYIVVPSKS